MPVGLEQDGARGVGQVTSGAVVEEGAVGDEDLGGEEACEEGEASARDDRLVELFHRRLILVVGGGVHVVIVDKEGVAESDAGREAHFQRSADVPPGKGGGGGHGDREGLI